MRTKADRISGATALGALLVLGGLTQGAAAADLSARKQLPPEVTPAAASTPVEFVFGARLQSDYNFRGISQSDKQVSPQAYGELQLFDNFLYGGVAAYRVDLPTRPAAEIDLTAGIRPKFGPFTFDLGVIYYYYPDERRLFDPTFTTFFTPANTDYLEIAGKVAYTYQDALTLGAGVFHAYDWLGSGAPATYISGTAKYVVPENLFGAGFPAGFAVSGEIARYLFGTTSPQLGSVRLPDYTYGNIGVSYTYQNVTLDLRYHDTDLSKGQCFTLTTDPQALFNGSNRSGWCDATFIGTLSVEFQASKAGVFASSERSAPPKEAGAGGTAVR